MAEWAWWERGVGDEVSLRLSDAECAYPSRSVVVLDNQTAGALWGQIHRIQHRFAVSFLHHTSSRPSPSPSWPPAQDQDHK